MVTTTQSTTETIASANELLAEHDALMHKLRAAQQKRRSQLHGLQPSPTELLQLSPLPSRSPSPPPEEHHSDSDDAEEDLVAKLSEKKARTDLPQHKKARSLRYPNYVPEEETIRNDYSQRYVDGGEWPQNWVLGAEPERRFEEYPKQQRLLSLKKASVAGHSLPPSYLPFSELHTLLGSSAALASAGSTSSTLAPIPIPSSIPSIPSGTSAVPTPPCKFDVILLDPPFSSSFTWDTLQDLPIPALAADPSFVFLWVGSGAGEGLERGREILGKWGYRRCEDVVWCKTNRTRNEGPGTDPPTTSLLTRTKQHCLIGIRGTVRRSTDSWFVHCNVDTDVIIWEGDPSDPTRKPPEMYTLIENFCLGLRRLEIFGRPTSLRRGWVTVLGRPPRSSAPKGSSKPHGADSMDGEVNTTVADAHPSVEDDEEDPLAQLDILDDGTVNVAGTDGGRGTRWTRAEWEEGIRELTFDTAAMNINNMGLNVNSGPGQGKPVVPMSGEIEALRPKSPVRGGHGGGGGGHQGGGGPRFGGGGRGGFNNPNQNAGMNMGMGMGGVTMGMGGMGMDMGGGGTSGGTMLGGPAALANVNSMSNMPMGMSMGVPGMMGGGMGGNMGMGMGAGVGGIGGGGAGAGQGQGAVDEMMGAAWNSLQSLNHLNAMHGGAGGGGGGMNPPGMQGHAGQQGMVPQNMQQMGMGGMNMNMGAQGPGGIPMNVLAQMAAAGGQLPPGMNMGAFNFAPGMFNPMQFAGMDQHGQGQFGGMDGQGQGQFGGMDQGMMGMGNMQGMGPGHMGQWGGGGGNF